MNIHLGEFHRVAELWLSLRIVASEEGARPRGGEGPREKSPARCQPQSNPPTPLIRGTPPMRRTELPNFRLLLAGVFPCRYSHPVIFCRLSCHLSAPSPDSKSAQPQSNPPTPLIRGTPPMWRTELPNFRLLLAGVFPCRYSRPVIFWRLSCHLSAPSPDSKSAGLVPGPASAKSSDQFAAIIDPMSRLGYIPVNMWYKHKKYV